MSTDSGYTFETEFSAPQARSRERLAAQYAHPNSHPTAAPSSARQPQRPDPTRGAGPRKSSPSPASLAATGGRTGTRSSGTLQHPDDEDLDREPPLLEELGVDPKAIVRKSLLVIRVWQPETNDSLFARTDLAGPIAFALLFGTLLLLCGKVQFGYIYGCGIIGCTSIHVLISLMRDPTNTYSGGRQQTSSAAYAVRSSSDRGKHDDHDDSGSGSFDTFDSVFPDSNSSANRNSTSAGPRRRGRRGGEDSGGFDNEYDSVGNDNHADNDDGADNDDAGDEDDDYDIDGRRRRDGSRGGGGGGYSFLHTVSTLGYALLPLLFVAALEVFVPRGRMMQSIIGFSIVVGGILWSTVSASRLLVSQRAIGDTQRWLISYPIFLFYAVFAMLSVF